MKVLLINGSPRPAGNTRTVLEAMQREFESQGMETEMLWIGNQPVRGCIACQKCYELGRCTFSDELYVRAREAVESCDALVVGSPTYYAGPNGSLCALLDRLFYSSGAQLRGKPACAVAICRRGGADCTADRLNKYFQILDMPMPTSNYWNIAFGRRPGEVTADAEGMQTAQLLARNLVWMMQAVAANPLPPVPDKVMTNFVRADIAPKQ